MAEEGKEKTQSDGRDLYVLEVGFHRWNLQRTEKDAPEKEDSRQSNP